MKQDIVKTAVEVLNSGNTTQPIHDLAAFAGWHALNPGQRECLRQLLFTGPVWDGNIVSKQARGELFDMGLAIRCCCYGEQGYTAATYRAFTLWAASGEQRCPIYPPSRG